MKIKLIIFVFLTIPFQSLFAQQMIPFIRATSNVADIRDGDHFNVGSWNISPQAKPDIYKTNSKNKKVTFYTNLDSISFFVKPGGKYNFVILLNNKDSAYTQIVYEPGIDSSKYAEDNWGNPIDIGDSVRHRTTVIVPISTSNCGYCLIDGYFVERNYFDASVITGGDCFHQCLFNPQLDIYAFEKHFNWDKPVLTYPPSLHKLHEDGFPTVLAFKDGEQVMKVYNNYDNYSDLRKLLWTDKQTMIPTGNIHMADRFFYENGQFDAVMVFPAGTIIRKDLKESGIKLKAYTCKTIDSLTKEDFQKHLTFAGKFTAKELSGIFPQKDIPIHFTETNIVMGEYSFPLDSVGVSAWFVSPFNPEKYVLISISNGHRRYKIINYLDFLIFNGKDSATYKQLLYGQYKQNGRELTIVPENTFSDIPLKEYCSTVCKIPVQTKHVDHAEMYKEIPVIKSTDEKGTTWTIGSGECRFPDIISDETKNVYIAFEQHGDIILTRIKNDKTNQFLIETNETDSYNPVVSSDGQRIWVFYLNNKDSYYRVYARFLENNKLSDEILISDKGPFDANTINVASKGEEISVIWGEWKANMRYLKMRKIIQGAMKEIEPVQVAPSKYTDGYWNAWYPSLCYLPDGKLWGAWNQHYPGLFCVISGKIGEMPQPVTQTAEKMDDWEMGGYPCIFTNRENKKFIVYESSGWDTYEKKSAQQIKISSFNDEIKTWSLASVVSDGKTFLSQTPVAVCDKNRNMIVCWSGRPQDEHSNWGIYLSMNISGKWSVPVCISTPGVSSRFPKITYNKKDNEIWVSWHTGIGKEMKTEVMKKNVDVLISNLNIKLDD
jgi:hypothetical protein